MLQLQTLINILKPFLKYLLIGVLILGAYIYCKTQYNSLQKDYLQMVDKFNEVTVDFLNSQNNYDKCRSALDYQNDKFKALEQDYNKTLEEFNKWKNRKPEIKYKYIYKTITRDVNISRDDCKDVDNLIDNIKTIDFGAL